MNGRTRYGALALALSCALGCTSDEERSLDAGSEQAADDGDASTAMDGGGLDAGDGAMVPARCVPLLNVPGSEVRSRFLRQELEQLVALDLARATSKVTLHVNLSADAAIGEPFDPSVPAATSHYSVPVDILDSLAVTHRLTLFFSRVPEDRWEWHAMVDGAEVAGGTPGFASERAAGLLSFDGGVLAAAETVLSADWAFPYTIPRAIDFEFGPTRSEDAGVPLTTMRPGPFATTFLQQNGSSLGELERLEVDADGTVTGVFADGSRYRIGMCF